MSNEEKRTILYDAVARAYNAIAETPGDEMKSERLGYLPYNLDRMENIAADLRESEAGRQEAPGVVESQNQCPGPDAGTAKESLAVETAEPEQTPTEAKEQETQKPTMTIEELKAVLIDVRKKGVNVPALLRQVGADSITTLTSNKYAEVMQLIEQELANAS